MATYKVLDIRSLVGYSPEPHGFMIEPPKVTGLGVLIIPTSYEGNYGRD